MSRRPQLSRQVPAQSVTRFDDWCECEGHVNGGDKGRRAEEAIIEYLPPMYRPERFRDDLDALEANLRADLDKAGHLNSDSSLNENQASTHGDETVKLTYRIAADVQEALEQYVYDQEGKVRKIIGEYVATALDEYRDGGQAARVRRYYEKLRESVDMVSEDRVQAVIETLHSEIGERDYYNIETIKSAVDKTLDIHSDDIRDTFADRVIERLEFVSVETSDGVYATPEEAEMIIQQDETRDLNWHLMDRDGRVEYLQEAVKARSKGSAMGGGVNYKQVRDEVFDETPSNDYCYTLMELAGRDSEFKYGKHRGQYMLRYTGKDEALKTKSDDEWIDNAAKRVREFCDEYGMDPGELNQPVLDNRIVQAKFPGEYDEVMGPSSKAIEKITEKDRKCVLDCINNTSDDSENEVEDKVSDELDRITTDAEPVTDGGQTGTHQ